MASAQARFGIHQFVGSCVIAEHPEDEVYICRRGQRAERGDA
jgi:hypothetical protein